MQVSETKRRLVLSLEESLGQAILGALQDQTVVEVMLNPDGTLFVERAGDGMRSAGTMSPSAAEIVIGKVAHALQTEVNEQHPIISGELPIGGHRFEGVLPPAATSPTFTIRKHAGMLISLERYVSDGIMSRAQADAVLDALSRRRNIVIAGGTGTGKTTLANAILAELEDMSPEDRLVILEDTAEIRCTAKNHVLLHTTDNVDMRRLLKSTMRLRPDRIIIGEVRDGAALTLLKAWNTGHPGGIATVHSNSARAALTRLEQLVAEASVQPMPEVIGEAVDLIVFIERAPGGRVVRDLLQVDGYRNGGYLTTLLHGSVAHTQGKLHVA